MPFGPLSRKKFQEYEKHALEGLAFLLKSDYEHALGDFRKSAEALMKIIILYQFGEIDGEKIILGEIDVNKNIIYLPRQLQYQDFVDIFFSHTNTIKKDQRPRLVDIQTKSNPSAHNPNTPIDYKGNAELVKPQLFEVTTYTVGLFGEQIPVNILDAFKGIIDESKLIQNFPGDWNEVTEITEGLSSQNKYLLIAPPRYDDCNKSQLQILSRINWSFVIDFNIDSKSSGLHHAFDNSSGIGFIPLTIKQKGQYNLVGAGSAGSINWLFGNGLNSISDTIVNSIKAWRSAKYPAFIKQVLTEFFSKTVHRFVIFYLWDDLDYVREIARIVSEIDEVPKDLVWHIFLTTNGDKKDVIERFDEFDIQLKVVNLTLSSFINGIAGSLVGRANETEKYLVPGRTKAEEQAVVDVSDTYQMLLADGIEIVHQNIVKLSKTDLYSTCPAFYRGEKITWTELASGFDADRKVYEELSKKVNSHLLGSKKSIKFDLYHKPGAGGTTLSRRLAFDLRTRYPIILVNSFDKGKTYRHLSVFLSKVNRAVLAVVEASQVSLNNLEELIRMCNANKLVICFVYVRRMIKLEKPGEFSCFLKDTMVDLEERDRFILKATMFAKTQNHLEELTKRQPFDCEVIDFPLAISESEYNNEKLVEYVKIYTDKMPEPQIKFLVFMSLVYYYSQKSISYLIVRSLFQADLNEEIRKTPIQERYIYKIAIQESDQGKEIYTEYWRPRFSKFAEAVLNSVVGQGIAGRWKDHLSLFAKEFISVIRENNEYLVNETHALLKGVFFDRNNEDLLGMEEQWQGALSNEQFSLLIKDIADRRAQKEVLLDLVTAYPNETHFQGHYGRFLYEKADEENDFKEAQKYINRALNSPDGEKDYNLQHIGGMCQRRHLEFLKRTIKSDDEGESIRQQIITLADSANSFFDRSILINPFNIHAYVAQIQTLQLAIDFARQLSSSSSSAVFITSDKNRWFLNQYFLIKSRLEQAKILVENQETLGRTNTVAKSKHYVYSGEARSYDIIGSYTESLDMYGKLIESIDRPFRPQLRLMYISSLLLSKVSGNKRKINEGWYRLKPEEVLSVNKLFKDNILQNPSDLISLRLWFKFVRGSQIDISIEEIISVVNLWYDQSEDSRLLHLEAAFYLYVLNACLCILGGKSFSKIHQTEAIHYIQKCRDLSNNTKYPFEYLGIDQGIDCLINHRDRPSLSDDTLMRIGGTITQISGRQEGRINLECGLDAFFVPVAGSFIQGKDETTEVTFCVGFRHDGLFAIDVRRKNDLTFDGSSEISDRQPEDDLGFVDSPIEEIDVPEIEQEPGADEIKSKSGGPKIVGHIDLSKIYDPRKKKR